MRYLKWITVIKVIMTPINHRTACYMKGIWCAFIKIYIMDKTTHYQNKMRSHLVTIVPMAPFAPKSVLTTTTLFIVTIYCTQ